MRPAARRLAGLLVLALLGVLALPSAAAPGGGISAIIGTTWDGEVRTFQLYVAPHVPTRKPVPLLLVLHGLFLDPASTEATSGLDRVADEQDVAVAYPAGLDGSWNAGTCCGPSGSRRVDDVGFLAHVVDLVATIRPIDLNRVYVTGFSNGGMMSLRAICQRPDVFAAAASVGGTLQVSCTGRSPLNALMLNGLRDTTVPFNGERYSSFLATRLTPVPKAIDILANRTGCAPVRTVGSYRHSTTVYGGCTRRAGLQLVVGPRLGHRWPTMQKDRIDGERIVWQFLSARRRAR